MSPWTPKDAVRHTKKASTPKKKRQWADVADSELSRGQSDVTAIRAADAVVAGTAKHRRNKDTVAYDWRQREGLKRGRKS